jgi:hypothetical protein
MKPLGRVKEIDHNDSSPSIYECISTQPDPMKKSLLAYLKCGKVGAISPEIPIDILSGECIFGTFSTMNDGKYFWRSDLIHYVEKYNFKLPEDFRQHVLNHKT